MVKNYYDRSCAGREAAKVVFKDMDEAVMAL